MIRIHKWPLLCAVSAVTCTPTERFVDEHCTVRTGDAWCEEQHLGARPFCANGCPAYARPGSDGCQVERPSDDACYSPCGGERSVIEDDSCLAADGESSSSTTTEGTSESTDSGESSEVSESSDAGVAACERDGDCGPATPICGPESTCTLCTEAVEPDASCAGRDPVTPACADDGTCVACTRETLGSCTGETPICNVDMFACEGCSWHEQCPATEPSLASAGCNMVTGACLPTERVLEVDGDEDAEFESIQDAIDDVAEGQEATILVHGLNVGSYQENVTVSGNRVIAMIAAPGEQPRLQGDGAPGLSISGGATVFVQGLHIRQGNGLGVRIDGSETITYIDRTHVVLNSHGGIEVTDGATLTVRNTFVGQGLNNTHAIRVIASNVTLLYTSVAAQAATSGQARALACDEASTVTARNSLFVAANDNAEVDCPGITVSNSASETLLAGVGNIELGDVQFAWFGNYDTGDLHLDDPPAALLTAALWEPGFPTVDIDGDPRPFGQSNRDVVGADVPTP